jgi:hypothetical protein
VSVFCYADGRGTVNVAFKFNLILDNVDSAKGQLPYNYTAEECFCTTSVTKFLSYNNLVSLDTSDTILSL